MTRPLRTLEVLTGPPLLSSRTSSLPPRLLRRPGLSVAGPSGSGVPTSPTERCDTSGAGVCCTPQEPGRHGVGTDTGEGSRTDTGEGPTQGRVGSRHPPAKPLQFSPSPVPPFTCLDVKTRGSGRGDGDGSPQRRRGRAGRWVESETPTGTKGMTTRPGHTRSRGGGGAGRG